VADLLPCTCHSDDLEPYCPRHTPLPGEDTSSAARVRVKETVNSTLRGKVLNVVRTERKRRMGSVTTSYLCEMPGYKHPGWFREEEVERVEA